jgi:GTP-binding protein
MFPPRQVMHSLVVRPMFIDSASIHVRAGKGGDGALSFRREKFVPKGGPDGGDGGRGGDVILKVNPGLRTLLDFRYKRDYKAENGRSGEGSNRTGRSGDSLVIYMPPGTTVYREDSGAFLGDLVDPDQELIVARGGKPGRGNARFATSTNRAPRKWEKGIPGEELTIRLELKLIADIGLVGAPNAGKSTLLSVLTDARPKIADYPFTTLTPNLGLIRFGGFNTAVIADIPGLIEGAHQGKGLGYDFLKHIERTRLLLVLVDCTLPDLLKEYNALMDELRQFNPKLLDRPIVSVLTKSDLIAGGLNVLPDYFDMAISSVTGRGLAELRSLLWERLSPLLKEN